MVSFVSTAGGVLETVQGYNPSGSALTLVAPALATMHTITLTANCTITLPAPVAGASFLVTLVQDATGGRLVTWVTPSGVIRWPSATAPLLSTTGGKIDKVAFESGSTSAWNGYYAAADMR